MFPAYRKMRSLSRHTDLQRDVDLTASVAAKRPLNMKRIENCMCVFSLADVYRRTDGENAVV